MSLRILSWNVNGLRAIWKKGFREWLRTENPDILCLQETKVNQDQLPHEMKEIEGYSAYYSDAERKGYSGVAILSRSTPLRAGRGFGIPKFDSEGRIQAADYGDFLLYSVYFPNGKASRERLDYKMAFYDAFLRHVDGLVSEGRNVIVCGDVNTAHREIDLSRPKENETVSGFLPEERAWIDTFVAHGFVDTFRMFHPEPGWYSWWDYKTKARERNVGWRIDYFFVNEGFRKSVTDAFILTDVMGSDHCPIGIEIVG